MTRAEKIADNLARTLSTRDSLDDNIAGLYDCLTFVLAQLCPDCRRSMATSICRQLLIHAEERAADIADSDEPTDCGHSRLH
jgi:hypothetical protein